MPNYGDPQYWEDRYKDNGTTSTFDWGEDYQTLKGIIDKLELDKAKSIVLNLGCGNSVFCEDMYDDGYPNIKNIDISKNVITNMKERNTSRTAMTWDVMDVRDGKYPDNSIDLAVDKSTIDALGCGNDSFLNVAKMGKEVQRVVKVGGYYMVISYGTPENRVVHFQREFLGFEVAVYTIKKGNPDEKTNEKLHYVYLCKKLDTADELCKQFYEKTIQKLEGDEKIEQEVGKKQNLVENH